MRTWTWLGIVSAWALAAGGCASNAAMAPVRADLARSGLVNDPAQVSKLEKSMTDDEIARLLDVNVQPKLPSAVALAKVSSMCSGYQPRLETVDAREQEGWRKALEGQHLVTGIHPISTVTAQNERADLRSLRMAAARMNCELLLVYMQADGEVDNRNDAAVLYCTIVGLWTVPGNVLEHRTVMQGALFDCRTGMVLGTVAGDSRLKRTYPAAFKDQRRADLAQEAPAAALADMHKGFGNLIRQLVAHAQTPAAAAAAPSK